MGTNAAMPDSAYILIILLGGIFAVLTLICVVLTQIRKELAVTKKELAVTQAWLGEEMFQRAKSEVASIRARPGHISEVQNRPEESVR